MNDALHKAQRIRREMVERGEKPIRLDPIQKSQEHPASKAKAIIAKCYDCVGRDHDPSWQWRVGNCECSECPLWPVRPHRRLEGTDTPASLR